MKALIAVLVIAAMGASSLALANHGMDTSPRPHLLDDVNRDYRSDVFFRGGTALAYSALAGGAGGPVVASGSYAGDAGPGYTLVGLADFDGDRSADALWSNGSQLRLWINDGAGHYTPVPVGAYGGGWQPFAVGDINADGRADVFFRGGTHVAYWLMDGPRVLRSSYAGDGGPGYHVVAIADFTGRNLDAAQSRSVDVLWTNGSQLKMWVSDAVSATFEPVALGSYGGGWEPFAGADVNGDAVADILFRGGTHVAYWEQLTDGPYPFQGFNYVSHYAGDGGSGFRAIAVGQYGDGNVDDILWSNGSELKVWLGLCTRWDWDLGCLAHDFVPQPLQGYGGGWQPVGNLIPPG